MVNGKISTFVGDRVDPRETRMRLTKSSLLLITVLRDPRAVLTVLFVAASPRVFQCSHWEGSCT